MSAEPGGTGEPDMSFLDYMATLGKDRAATAQIAPFGRIAGVSENLREQPARLYDPFITTGLSVLKGLGRLPFPDTDVPGPYFVEHYHPYLYAIPDIETLPTTSRGVDPEVDAGAFGDFLTDLLRVSSAQPRRVLFIDDLHMDDDLKHMESMTKMTLPDGTVIYSHVQDGKRVFTFPDLAHSMYDVAYMEAGLIPMAHELTERIIERASTIDGVRIKGDRRKKVRFQDGREVYLTDKDGETPTCELLDVAYRLKLMKERGAHDEDPYAGGVIILPDSFRTQQQRVLDLLSVLGEDLNIVTMLLD